jgi:hypothetical protein
MKGLHLAEVFEDPGISAGGPPQVSRTHGKPISGRGIAMCVLLKGPYLATVGASFDRARLGSRRYQPLV